MDAYAKTGYLTEAFKYFHITTKNRQEFHFHYHDFHKILFFLQGNVTYQVEGRSFSLVPGDVVLIPAGEIHRPALNRSSVYERIILYLDPGAVNFFKTQNPLQSLDSCFQKAKNERANVLRVPEFYREKIYSLCLSIEEEQEAFSQVPDFFASELYQRLLVTELLVLLNRAAKNQRSAYPENACGNPQILRILDYINNNLKENLSIDAVASHFYLNRYYLMHFFKQYTGYTLGQYISLKRLLYAKSLIQKGVPVTEACFLCGYQNYSTFSRAYQKHFHKSPKKR